MKRCTVYLYLYGHGGVRTFKGVPMESLQPTTTDISFRTAGNQQVHSSLQWLIVEDVELLDGRKV